MVMMEIDDCTMEYIKAEQRKAHAIASAKTKMQAMQDDLKVLSTEDFKKKYGNPQSAWANIVFEMMLAKKGMTMEEYKEQGRKNARRRKEKKLRQMERKNVQQATN